MIVALKKFKYLIIVTAVVVVGFVLYTIFTSPTDTSTSSFSKSTSGTAGSEGTQSNDLAKTFVDQLLTIQNINLKTEFFSDSVFTGLKDNHVDIEPQAIGRPNPFAPIGKDAGSSSNYQDINGTIIKSTDGVPTSVFGNQKTTSGAATETTTATTSTPIKSTKTKTQ